MVLTSTNPTPCSANSIPDLVTDHHPSFTSPSAFDVVTAGHSGDFPVVERGLQSDDPKVRAAALGAILRLGRLDPQILINCFADDTTVVRRRAAELAARLEHSAALESGLVELLGDVDVIAEVAAFSLGELGSQESPFLEAATIEAIENQARGHADSLCREAAVAALGALHTGLPTILEACNDKATVRRRAIIALAPFEGPEVDSALERALDDRDWQVRQAAEDLLEPQVSDDSAQS